jgi:hypothetical protein
MIKLGGLVTLKPITEAPEDRYVSIGFGKYKEKGKEDDKNAPTFEKDGNKFVPISTHKAAAKDAEAKKDTPKVNIFKKDKEEPKKDEPVRDDQTDAQIEDVQNNIDDMPGDEIQDYAESDIFPYLKGRDLELAKMYVDDIEAAGDDFDRSADLRKDLKDLFDKKMTLDSPKEEPKGEEPKKDEPRKDSTGGRAGNIEVNKEVRLKSKRMGITSKNLGKEEYERRMSQAAVEALTDSNFHSEARKLIAMLEDNPDFAKDPRKDPNMPDISSPEYDKWRKSSVYGSEYYDSSPGTDEIGQFASQEASWDGRDALDAIAFDMKLNGSKELALKMQSIFDDTNESTTSIADMIPESIQINEGTRSQVGVIGRNGKIVSAYVHFDGYPRNMKPGLKKHMKNEKDVLTLIKKGGARGIFDDKEIEYYNTSQKPLKGDFKDIKSYINDAGVEGGAEYVYLYNMKDKKWYFADVYGKKELKKLF